MGALRGVIQRILREPLTHFLVLGVLIFAGVAGVKALKRPVVQIDADEFNQLVSYWEIQMQRPPTKAELNAILRERMDEELMAREAIRLGLDRNDLIIRRRLAQKMAFASEDLAPVTEPDEATLRAYYEKTKSDYIAPGHISLRQVVFSGDRPDSRDRAARALVQVAKGPVTGDPFVLPLVYADASLIDLGRDYGPAFQKAIETARPGTWVGPVQTPYGWHILTVETRHEAAVESFDEARSAVRDAWLAQRRQAGNAEFLAGLRRRYRVDVPGLTP